MQNSILDELITHRW